MSLAWFFQAENFLDQLPGSFFGSAPMLISGLSFVDIKKDVMDTADTEHAYKLLFCISIYFIYQGCCCILKRVLQEQAPPFYGDRTCLRKKQWYRVSPFVFYSLDASRSYTFSLNESRSSRVQLQWYIYYFIVANYQKISLTESTKTFRQKLVPL